MSQGHEPHREEINNNHHPLGCYLWIDEESYFRRSSSSPSAAIGIAVHLNRNMFVISADMVDQLGLCGSSKTPSEEETPLLYASLPPPSTKNNMSIQLISDRNYHH